MQVERCRILGYCHGVSDTIKKANRCLALAEKKNIPVYSIGNLIHNEHVVKHFTEKGMRVINKPQDAEPGIALIRAHGMPDTEKRAFTDAGFSLVDSTCSNIIKTLLLIDRASQKERTILIIGEKGHAETLNLLGRGDSLKTLVSNQQDLESFISSNDHSKPLSVFVQTTFSQQLYESFCKTLEESFSDVSFENKLCLACIQRKKYALDLAKRCGCMVVIGSKSSSNSKELSTWLSSTGKPVYMFSEASDIDLLAPFELKKLSSYGIAGVCSGTSAPKEVIDSICNRLLTL